MKMQFPKSKAHVLGQLAELYAEDGGDLPADLPRSYDLFQEAAEAALGAGQRPPGEQGARPANDTVFET